MSIMHDSFSTMTNVRSTLKKVRIMKKITKILLITFVSNKIFILVLWKLLRKHCNIILNNEVTLKA